MEYYKLVVSEEHLKTLMLALESYARLGLGQIENVLGDLGFHHYEQFKEKLETFHTDEEYTAALKTIKEKVFNQPLNGSMGIHNDKVDVKFKTSWEMYQSMRSHIAWAKQPEGGITVDFHRPKNTSGIGLITVKSLGENEDAETATDN